MLMYNERLPQILQEERVVKADFHCFCGKAKLGQRIAAAGNFILLALVWLYSLTFEYYTHSNGLGYYLSIPSCVERNAGFQQLVSKLPMNRVLTETDSPYQVLDRRASNHAFVSTHSISLGTLKGPDRGERNDPSTVLRAVVAIAKVRLTSPSAPIAAEFALPDDPDAIDEEVTPTSRYSAMIF